MNKEKLNNQARKKLLQNIEQRLQLIGQIKESLAFTIQQMEKEMDTIRDKYVENFETLESNLVLQERILKADMKKANTKWGDKSLRFPKGSIVIRAGKYCVKELNNKITKGTVIAMVRAFFGSKYIRTKEELNRAAIIKAYAGKMKLLSDKDLAEVGLRIEREEIINYKIIKSN